MEPQSINSTVFDDLANIEKTLTDDLSGEAARGMLALFDDAVKETEARLPSLDAAEHQFSVRLIEGFRAAQRIVRNAWESIHGAAMMV